MSGLNRTMHGQLIINGNEVVDLKRAPLRDLIQRMSVTLHNKPSSSISSIQFNTSLTPIDMIIKEDENDINVMLRKSMERQGLTIHVETPEEKNLRESMATRQAHPMYPLWSRATGQITGERFRNNMGPGEWNAVRATAKELWPDEYESRKHLFNG